MFHLHKWYTTGVFIRWQNSEIRKIAQGLYYNPGIQTHSLCRICACPKIEKAKYFDAAACDLRNAEREDKIKPGWYQVKEPKRGNRCEYGCLLTGGRVVRDKRLKAVLCESVRVEGKPKQRHVAFLGTIEESWLPRFFDEVDVEEAERMKVAGWYRRGVEARHWFWWRVSRKLDALDNRLLRGEREKLEAALAKVIPRPTQSESLAVERHAIAEQRSLAALLRKA